MGTQLTYLNEPNLEKEIDENENEEYDSVAWSMQGWRTNMEDAHLLELDFEPGMHLFGVFDGHGGKEVAMFAAKELIQTFKNSFPSKSNPFKGKTVNEELMDPDSVEQALINSFIELDKKLSTKQVKKELMGIRKKNPEGKNPFLELLGLSDEVDRGKSEGINIFDSIGCTANVLFIHDGKYYCANAGDSRWVISQRGKAVELSQDHKPEDPIEFERIRNAGSNVIEGRVDGNLNLSRSIGDLHHKQKDLPVEEQPITWVPDVTIREIDEDDDFIVLAWDGVWEVKDSQQVVDFIDEKLSTEMDIEDIVKELLNEVCSEDCNKDQSLGCDNMTCIIINIKR